jgi:CheY-like chemotaxis protein
MPRTEHCCSQSWGADGHSILESGDGTEALAVLEQNKVDTIVSDILMPRMDGYRFFATTTV